MTTLLKSAAERAALLTAAAPLPVAQQSGDAAAAVVILAGGFNCRFVADIRAKAAEDTIERDSSLSMLRRTKAGVEHVPAGLQNVGDAASALAGTLAHLLSAHQLAPLQSALYVVTNRANHEEVAGAGGFFDTAGRFDRAWQSARVVCNGAAAPEEWAGHAADLRLALARAHDDGDRPVLVIDANLFFWPRFNFQKVVSNMIIRNRHTIALLRLTATDAQLYGTVAATAAPADGGQVPPLAAFATADAPAVEGACVPLPLVFLPTTTGPAATRASAARTLPQLFGELFHGGVAVYGAALPWGAFDLSTLLPHRYVQRYMLYSAAARARIGAYEATREQQSDTILSLLQECDDTGLGRSKIVDEAHATLLAAQLLDEQHREFDRHFFACDASRFKGYQRPAYKLPSTFYMSTYRAQVAEATI